MDGTRLPAPGERGAVVLVSGWRRVGKTTLLLRLRAVAVQIGLRLGGFLSVARFEQDIKTGIDLLNAATGEVLPLATTGGNGPVQTGHYTFDPAALTAGLNWAEAGQAADLFFIDELGPLELVRGAGWAGTIPLIQARAFGAAFVVVRPELLDTAREMLDLPPDSAQVVVDETNRDALCTALSGWLGEWGREVRSR